MKICDSITGQEHLEIRIDKKFVNIEPIGTDQVITDELKELLVKHGKVTLKDLFQYFGFITTLSMKSAKIIMKILDRRINQ